MQTSWSYHICIRCQCPFLQKLFYNELQQFVNAEKWKHSFCNFHGGDGWNLSSILFGSALLKKRILTLPMKLKFLAAVVIHWEKLLITQYYHDGWLIRLCIWLICSLVYLSQTTNTTNNYVYKYQCWHEYCRQFLVSWKKGQCHMRILTSKGCLASNHSTQNEYCINLKTWI